MKIGEDFSKITIEFQGLTFLEPNAFLSDLIMGGLGVYFACKLYKRRREHSFLKYWYYYFLTFGLGSILGGFAHTLFLYTGAQGKFPTWISGILCVYFIEKAMIKSVKQLNTNNILGKISFFKMILVFLLVIMVISTPAYQKEHTIGFIPIAFNTLIGVFVAVAGISIYNLKRSHKEFRLLLNGVLIMLPSFFVFMFKVNLAPWFDKGDLAHVLITLGNVLFYLGVLKVAGNRAVLDN